METILGEERKERKKKERRKKEERRLFSVVLDERAHGTLLERREREREKRESAMVVVQAWDDFYAKAEELLRSKPLDCRYTVKYKHNEGKMVLKVTDDSQVRNENVFK